MLLVFARSFSTHRPKPITPCFLMQKLAVHGLSSIRSTAIDVVGVMVCLKHLYIPQNSLRKTTCCRTSYFNLSFMGYKTWDTNGSRKERRNPINRRSRHQFKASVLWFEYVLCPLQGSELYVLSKANLSQTDPIRRQRRGTGI